MPYKNAMRGPSPAFAIEGCTSLIADPNPPERLNLDAKELGLTGHLLDVVAGATITANKVFFKKYEYVDKDYEYPIVLQLTNQETSLKGEKVG